MANCDDADPNRIKAANAVREKAHEVARSNRELALKAAIDLAKDEYEKVAAATAAQASKVESAKVQAAINAKYEADHAFVLAETVYQAAIEKAEIDYVEALRLELGLQ